MNHKNDIIYLYHVGEHKPQPYPCKYEIGILPGDRDKGVFTPETTESYTWYRSWLPGTKAKAGVFLTPDPYRLSYYDWILGKIYQYAVPRWVVKACGGIHRAALIHEVLILPEFWPYCKLVSSKTLNKKKIKNIRDGEWRRNHNRIYDFQRKKILTGEDAQKTLSEHNRKKKRAKREKKWERHHKGLTN